MRRGRGVIKNTQTKKGKIIINCERVIMYILDRKRSCVVSILVVISIKLTINNESDSRAKWFNMVSCYDTNYVCDVQFWLAGEGCAACVYPMCCLTWDILSVNPQLMCVYVSVCRHHSPVCHCPRKITRFDTLGCVSGRKQETERHGGKKKIYITVCP